MMENSVYDYHMIMIIWTEFIGRGFKFHSGQLSILFQRYIHIYICIYIYIYIYIYISYCLFHCCSHISSVEVPFPYSGVNEFSIWVLNSRCEQIRN